jgi:hypothetical protein
MDINQTDATDDLGVSAANSNGKQGHWRYNKELRWATRLDTWRGDDNDTRHFSEEPSRHTDTKQIFSELSYTPF